MKFFLYFMIAVMTIGSLFADDVLERTRTWTNREGTSSFEGTIVKADKTKAMIKLKGKSVTASVPLAKLSDEDQEWIIENREAINAKPASKTKSSVEKSSSIGQQFSKIKPMNNKIKGNDKYYIILYSASWCPPCRKEMPRVVKLYNERIKNDPNIELILASCDRSKGEAKAWSKEHNMGFPIVEPDDKEKVDIITKYAPNGIPSAVLVESTPTGSEDNDTLIVRALPTRAYNKYAELTNKAVYIPSDDERGR